MKIISQRKCPTSNNANSKPASTFSTTSNTKTTYQKASQFTPTMSVTTSAPSTITGTHSGPMDLSSAGRQGPLLEQEKKRRNKLGLCKYCGQAGHIARDHSDLTTLLAKHRAAGINELTIYSAPPTPASSSENALSPSTVALRDFN